MSDPVIQVENLGKRYTLGHQQEGHSRYVALRDVITGGAKSMVRRLRHPSKHQTSTSREEFWALKDVSFEVKQGEVVGIIGRNGAGKSTLLKLLSRITEPTTGQIRLRGRVASLLEVGTGFHPELTGRENISLNGAILGMSRAEINRKFDEIVEFAEVSRFLDTPVKRYSSGMYVRLAFAVAAHLEPEILVVDEVLAVGDIQFQKKCLGKMGEVSQSGKTVIVVSHNMAVIRSLCSQAILLDQGGKVFDGNPEEAITSFLNNSIESEAEYTWAERSCNEIVFKRAFISNSKEEIVEILNVSDDFYINLEYEVNSPMDGIRIGFLMKNQEDVIICGSNVPDVIKDCKSIGSYVTRCRFPAHTLNSGRYSIMFGADTLPFFRRILTSEYCIHFTIQDLNGHGVLNEQLPGIVRPRLDWANSRLAIP